MFIQGVCGFPTGLLYDDPLRAWLSTARSVEVETIGGAKVQLRRSTDGWTDAAGRTDAPEALLLASLEDWRSTGELAGEPAGEPTHRLVIRRDEGVDVTVEIGTTWARAVASDVDWYYQARPSD